MLSWISEQDADDLYVTVITLAEIAYGVERLPAGRRKAMIRSTAKEAITAFHGRALAFDEGVVPHYARIVTERELAGRPMDAFDGQIAAICAALDAPLATRNTRDFDQTGITVINPWDSA